MTHISAKSSSNNGDGIEDAIIGAFHEIIIYIKLTLPFLDNKRN
jgi:hypothetical protein